MSIYSFTTYAEANLFKTLRDWEGRNTCWFSEKSIIVW